MRARPRRKPKRQWRQDIRTRPQPRSTQRRAAYHKCAAKTVRPTCRTGSVTWRGSSTHPPAPPRQRHLSQARRHAAQEPLLRPSRHRSRQRTPRGRKAPQHERRSRTTPSPKPGPQRRPRRRRTQPLSPLRRARPHPSIASSPANHHGQAGPPPHRQRDQLQATARPDRQGSTNRRAKGRTGQAQQQEGPAHHPTAGGASDGGSSTGQAVEPSASVRTTGNRQRQAAAKPSDSPAPTPRPHASPSPDNAPS